MFGIGPKELVILALIIVLLFGARKIPELARAIGDSLKILRGSISDDDKSNANKGNLSSNERGNTNQKRNQ